jgi:lipopolysaccharide export system protein LptC
MTYKKYVLLSFITIVAILLSTWTVLLTQKKPDKALASSTPLPDGFMEDVTAVIMNKYGKPRMKVLTSKLLHFPEDDTTHLSFPKITIYRQSPQPWYVRANYATAKQGIDHIDFFENVTLHHPADQHNPATMITTPTLSVHTQEEKIETQAFITLTQANTVINAKGMQVEMRSGDVKLLSEARGEYVPKP